jgi:hypothetical protein
MNKPVRMIQVGGCKECPFAHYNGDAECWVDEEEPKRRPNTDNTPEWCPLKFSEIVLTNRLVDLVYDKSAIK